MTGVTEREILIRVAELLRAPDRIVRDPESGYEYDGEEVFGPYPDVRCCFFTAFRVAALELGDPSATNGPTHAVEAARGCVEETAGAEFDYTDYLREYGAGACAELVDRALARRGRSGLDFENDVQDWEVKP